VITDLVLAHHPIVASIPFVMPAFLVVGAIFVLRSIERRRGNTSSQ
jgi:hypothetical protein